MYTLTNFDQTDRSRTDPLVYYNNTSPDKYLSNTDSYNDNDSNCESDDYNNYESNYESDIEKTPCASTSTTRISLVQLPNVKEQKANMAYTLKREKFNDNFFSKDLLN